MNHHEQAKMGREASQALPAIDAAFDLVRDGLMKKLMAESPVNRDQIIALHGSIQAVEAARQAVRQVIGNGQLAEQAIEAANRS